MLGSIYSYGRFEGIGGYSLLSLSCGIFVRRQSPPINFGLFNTKQLECKSKGSFLRHQISIQEISLRREQYCIDVTLTCSSFLFPFAENKRTPKKNSVLGQ